MWKRTIVVTVVSLAFLLEAGLTGDAAAATPCPIGSSERDFRSEDLANCLFGATEGNSVGARYDRYYNVYCPGRMTKSQAAWAANALARNDPRAPASNPIPTDFAALGLVPRYAASSSTSERGVHHLFHYSCVRGGSTGVATHIKVEIGSELPSSSEVARRCSAVNRAGSVRVGTHLDLEYRCRIHLWPEERRDIAGSRNCPGCRPPFVELVAALKARADVVPEAMRNGAKTCLLASTDIQCAPCKSSDKLVARFAFVGSDDTCPAGTVRVVTP